MDKIIQSCPTCGSPLPDYKFKVGDKVRHMNGAEGLVDKIGLAVHVQFDGYRGTYDRGWFTAYPNGLTKI